MGEVWAAHDLRLDRPVAVKLLMAPIDIDPPMRARFRTEARAAAGLSHPNVVTVFDSGEDDGRLFLVMELLPGRTLADELGRGRLSAAQARAVAAQVLAALAASHRAGILHRDIKPANVLFAADGTARVADFGIAKSLECGDATATGLILGTTAYMAPERLAGQPATPQGDLYAVGAMLYEALAGRRPFEADTPLDTLGMLRAIEQQAVVPLHELQPSLDPALVAAVERSLAKDPRDRFPSASEMAAAIKGDNATRDRPSGPETTTVMTAPVTVMAARSPASPTEVLPAAGPDPTTVGPAPGGSSTSDVLRASGERPWWRTRHALVGGLVIGVLSVLAGLVVAQCSGPSSNSPPATSEPAGPGASLPDALDDALRQLEEVVRP
jgi:serine/threonine protein kinase